MGFSALRAKLAIGSRRERRAQEPSVPQLQRMRRKREAPEGALPLEAESPKAAKRPFAERARWPFLLLGVLALHAVRAAGPST